MRIVTWNVNSLKARWDRLLAVLERHEPDVVCLQELKLEDSAFPREALEDRGYHAVAHGQRTYNGVAILSRSAPTEAQVGLPDGVEDPQARFVSARIDGVRVLSCYVPNGSEPSSDKFRYKLEWLDRLIAHVRPGLAEPLVLCGDLNIAPELRDVARPEQWEGTVLCHPEVRKRFGELLALGLVDCVRLHHEESGLYSWWDYRMLGFAKGNGLRIDHVLASAPMAERCSAAFIDREERKGKLPSDHAPVIADFRGAP
jgi:exodeoxyribonuclease-3